MSEPVATVRADPAPRSPNTPFTPGAFLAMAFVVGFSAFGGGFAIIANIKQRVVDQHGWMTAEEFAEALGIVAALPGTNAANLLTLVGVRHGGLATGALGATLFLLPGLAIILAFAIFYDRMRSLPGLGGVLEGITAAVVGVIAAVADELRPGIVKRRRDALFVALAFVALATHVLSLLEVVAIAGVLGVLSTRMRRGGLAASFFSARAMSGWAGGAAAAGLGASAALFVAFAKISLATFGGGVAMLPAVEREVMAHAWVPASELADSIAFAQITPGPIANCATFLGYRVAGWAGATAATLGVFLPPLFLCLFVARRIAAVNERPTVRGFLRGVSIAVVGAIAAAAYSVYRVGVHGAVLTLLAIAVFVWRKKRPKDSTILTLAVGGVLGALRVVLAR